MKETGIRQLYCELTLYKTEVHELADAHSVTSDISPNTPHGGEQVIPGMVAGTVLP